MTFSTVIEALHRALWNELSPSEAANVRQFFDRHASMRSTMQLEPMTVARANALLPNSTGDVSAET